MTAGEPVGVSGDGARRPVAGAGDPVADSGAEAELRADERTERLIFWKGLLSLAVVAVVVWVRQRYLS